MPAQASTPKTIEGEFEVKIIPEELQDGEDPSMGAMKLDKVYSGPLAATGKGRMLTGMGNVKGSAAYVAIERIEGALEGKQGTFLIHHRGIMNRSEPNLEIMIVPDSGSGELAGIVGKMKIDIREGKHFYALEYEIKKDLPK